MIPPAIVKKWLSSLLFLLLGALPSSVMGQDVDTETCFSALLLADGDFDGRVGMEEYVEFLRLFGPNSLNVSAFDELPVVLQSNFFILACGCQGKTVFFDSDCCESENAYLPVPQVSEEDEQKLDEANNLLRICWSSRSALNRWEGAEEDQSAGTSPPSMLIGPSPQPISNSGLDAVAKVSYTIVVQDGLQAEITARAYQPDLVTAMDSLSLLIAHDFNERSGGYQVLPVPQIRPLAVDTFQVRLPSRVDSIKDAGGFTTSPSETNQGRYDGNGPCPADLGRPAFDRCERVFASVGLILLSQTIDPVLAQQLFQSTLVTAVSEGRLQELLQNLSSTSVVTIVTGQSITISGEDFSASPFDKSAASPRVEDDGVSGGAAVGVGISVFAIVSLAGAVLVMKRHLVCRTKKKRRRAKFNHVGETMFGSVDEEQGHKLTIGETLTLNDTASTTDLVKIPEVADGAAQVDIGCSYIGDISRQIQSDKPPSEDDVEPLSCAEPCSKKASKEEGSLVSDSGWSSDMCASSMGTMDSGVETEDELVTDTKIVDLYADREVLQTSVIGVARLQDLETSIMVGDWAAVGASAAILASSQYDSGSDRQSQTEDESGDASYSGMGSSIGGSWSADEWRSRDTSGPSWKMAVDSTKVTELDQLIESGDWEAVIEAAAKFEAEEQRTTNREEGDSTFDHKNEDTEEGSENLSIAMSAPSTMVPSVSTFATCTNKQGLASIRANLVELVRQVVPEEVGNIDSLLAQFEGREEDLIDTLKAMRHQVQSQK